MNLYFRFFWLILKHLLQRPAQNLFDECETFFRVNPFDLDINFHMNNGRYLALMDLGRLDLMLKAGVFWKLFSRQYFPVVVSESIYFKRSLEPFDLFSIKTKIDSWDEKDFFIHQTFSRKGEIVAIGYIKGRFLRRGFKGSVLTENLFQFLGFSPPSHQKMSPTATLQVSIENNLKSGPPT